MTMKKQLVAIALLALLLVPAAVFAQEQAPEHGMVEFGFRGVTGDVDADRRLPSGANVPFSNGFRPDVLNSTLNTYNDYRNGFYVPKFNMLMDDFLGTKSYFSLQSASSGFSFEGLGTLNRDQSFLATVGHYSLYKIQFRFDETPHIFSGTTRTVFGGGGEGVWNVNPTLQSRLYNIAKSTSIGVGTDCNTFYPGATSYNACLAQAMSEAVSGTGHFAGTGGGAYPFAQQESRKTGALSANWNVTPNWNTFVVFSRENQIGTRPVGMALGGSTAFNVEIPEPIDYYTTNVKVGTEFGKKRWDAMLAYQTSLFQNNISSVLVNNPFSTIYGVSPTPGAATDRMSLPPDNRYQQFVTQGAVDIAKNVRFMANVTPGLMTQDARFQPTTTNDLSLVAGGIDLTPAPGHPNMPTDNLHGGVNTLAMNYTLVVQAMKNLQLSGKYQQYDYSNHTPELEFRDVFSDSNFFSCNSYTVGVTTYSGYCPTEQSSFHRKTFDLSGTYFITKKNSAKIGYQREWMERDNRNVGSSIENSIYAATDLNLRKDLLLRVSARHQSRLPEAYDYAADGINIANPHMRYLDEATRLRTRGDVSLLWNATDKLSITGFWGTLQDNYNVRDSSNSLTSLNDLSHSPGINATTAPAAGTITTTYGPYYSYGLLNNIGTNFGVDANYVLTKNVVLFAEYSRENNRGRIVNGRSKGSLPFGAGLAQACALNASGYWTVGVGGATAANCDPINDVMMVTRDVVNTYFGGADVTLKKKLNVSVYYGLSAAQSNINTDGVNCQVGGHAIAGTAGFCKTNFVDWSLDNNTATAPPAQTFNYPENVSRTHEVGAIVKFKLTKNLLPKFQYTFRKVTNVDWQTGVMNPFSYVGTALDPGSGTATTSNMQKGLFLGADTPGYKAHLFSATMEYHF